MKKAILNMIAKAGMKSAVKAAGAASAGDHSAEL